MNSTPSKKEKAKAKRKSDLEYHPDYQTYLTHGVASLIPANLSYGHARETGSMMRLEAGTWDDENGVTHTAHFYPAKTGAGNWKINMVRFLVPEKSRGKENQLAYEDCAFKTVFVPDERFYGELGHYAPAAGNKADCFRVWVRFMCEVYFESLPDEKNKWKRAMEKVARQPKARAMLRNCPHPQAMRMKIQATSVKMSTFPRISGKRKQ
jgi:hypothetical protein